MHLRIYRRRDGDQGAEDRDQNYRTGLHAAAAGHPAGTSVGLDGYAGGSRTCSSVF
jgi:hypothetical protein